MRVLGWFLLLVGLVLAWFLLSPVVALILALLGAVLALLGFFVKWLLPLALLLLALWLLLSPRRPVPEGW